MVYIIPSFALALILAACGTNETKSTPAPTQQDFGPSPSAPLAPAPQPQYLPAPQIPSAPEQQLPSLSGNQDAPVSTDPFGAPYDMNAEIPFSADYTYQQTSQFNPMAPAYYSEVESYLGMIAQPVVTDAANFQLPLLYDRYCQHRALLNYYPTFRQVKKGNGPWDNGRYQRARDGFDHSRRWVNGDLFQLIEQTLDSLRRRQYYSSRGLEGRIRDAIKRRDHRLAAELHDQLVREAASQKRSYERQGPDRKNKDGRDKGRGDERRPQPRSGRR